MEIKIYNELIGQIAIEVHQGKSDERWDEIDQLDFILANGKSYRFTHFQDCCENVYIEDIIGDLNDLIGSPILMAEEISYYSGDDNIPNDLIRQGEDSYTWTFYKFATIKGYVTVRWIGTSNGYYSESVDFEELEVK